MTIYTDDTLRRFWEKVDQRGVGDCWPWLGGLGNGGYGKLKLEGTRVDKGAHVIAFELANGPVLEGPFVCHHCDNPPCCNPDHLFAGTCGDNVRDASKKGRLCHSRATGSDNGNAVLTESDVIEIMGLIVSGDTNTSIGRRFGVTHSMISRIKLGLSWTHVRAVNRPGAGTVC